jgi:Ca2+-binding RTX toxin-like protein
MRMSSWTTPTTGAWNDPALWTGGVPNNAGAVAEFTVANPASGTVFVTLAQDELITVGTMNIVTDTDDGWLFRGAVATTNSTLRFGGVGGSPAYLNVDTNGSTRETTIASTNGMRVSLVSDLILTTQNSDTVFRISAPLISSGDLFKHGDGTLQLNGDNASWTGDLNLFGGRTEIFGASNIGSATLTFDNGGVLAVAGNTTIANRLVITGGNAVGTIAAGTGLTLTLSGDIVQATDALSGFQFGSSTDAGTIVLTGSSVVLGDAGFTVAGGTVRIGNATVASNFFSSFSSDGLLQLAGTLDTNGFATSIDNLDFDGGTLRSSAGTLNVTVNDTFSSANSQSGSIAGTAGADQIVINVAIDWSAVVLTFTSWTNGVDTIRFNGSAGANNLVGSTQNDIINGAGGADAMSGGGGDDVYSLDNLADVVTELVGSGNDTVYTLVDTTLSANVESLILVKNGNQNGTGSADNNWIYGNAFNNTIDGGLGSDFMAGGAGDDIYMVNIGFDAPNELANNGTDQVYSSTDYQISDHIEVLLLTGAAVLGIGNNGNNWLYGTASANSLQGLGGSDTIYGYGGTDTIDGGAGIDDMRGGADSDIYYVDNVADFITELGGEGTNDAVYTAVSYGVAANVESVIANTATGLGLSGNNGANFVIGNAGADMLDAYGASDWMQGQGGNDTFVLRKGMTSGDVIDDFAGNGAAAGDQLLLIGWGAGAFLTNLGGGNWLVQSTLGNEIFSTTNGATLDASDFAFV